jgi:signal transduction histidine kinase
MLSIKAKQVAGVTLIVGLAVILLSAWYISSLASILLVQTEARARLLENAVRHRLTDVLQQGDDPIAALQTDGGLESILQSSIYADNVTYGAIVDPRGIILACNLPEWVGSLSPPAEDLETLLALSPTAQARAIFFQSDQLSYEFRSPPLVLGEREFGTIRIGVSTLVLREDMTTQMRTPVITALIAILLASVVAMVLAQITLRPIHVIRSGLARLGRGELDVDVDLPDSAEMTELGDSFKAVSARLAADRTELAGSRATLESVVRNLEDAVALFSPDGTLLFANPAMRPVLAAADGPLSSLLPPDHPYRVAVEVVLETRAPLDPRTAPVSMGGERLILAHPFENAEGEFLGVMLVARNLTYLAQVQSTISYSRKLAALGRLTAGIAHEVKNPLNATMIHLELLKMRLGDTPEALEHVSVIAAQVRRLDEVVQGFLKFTRPEELRLRPVVLAPLIEDILPVVQAEALPRHVEVRVELARDLPAVSADSSLLQQAFLNLALNACQAMPEGGRLRIAANRTPQGLVEILFQDTGVGIPPDQLARIFDLYFTTREHGSGIGLSLVYRTIQLHDGEIEVSSTPGRGTTFRILLHEAPAAPKIRRAPGILGLEEPASFEPDDPVSAS